MIDVGGAKTRNDQGGKWKIVDIAKSADYTVDLNKGKLPFKDGEVMYIYCSHTLEHLEPIVIGPMLLEFKRILNKKGIIRIAVPDCELAIKWYLKNSGKLRDAKNPSKKPYIPATPMGYLTCWFYTDARGHRMGFDWELLRVYLENAGFSKITRKKWGKCSDVFVGKDYPRYRENTIYVEVSK